MRTPPRTAALPSCLLTEQLWKKRCQKCMAVSHTIIHGTNVKQVPTILCLVCRRSGSHGKQCRGAEGCPRGHSSIVQGAQIVPLRDTISHYPVPNRVVSCLSTVPSFSMHSINHPLCFFCRTPDSGLLTETLKIKRHAVVKQFRSQIEKVYSAGKQNE
jgi:hypothetical protein